MLTFGSTGPAQRPLPFELLDPPVLHTAPLTADSKVVLPLRQWGDGLHDPSR
jgi:hypothetical protein